MEYKINPDASTLRQRAEELLGKKQFRIGAQMSESEVLTLMREVEVQQIEIELQQEFLVASETRYRRLFESAKDGILILDAETGMIIDVNPFLTEMLGYSKDQFIERPIWEIGFFNDIVADIDKFSELQQKEYIRYENLPFETADGQKLSVEFVSHVYLVDKKKVIQCTIHDMTEHKRVEEQALRLLAETDESHRLLLNFVEDQKQTEAELRKSEARMHTLVQTIPDLIWLKDTNGVYLSCNSMFERFFGAREADIIGKTDYNFVDRKLADFFCENDRKAMAAGKSTSNEEWVTFADDGHQAFLETIKTPMYDSKGTIIGILGVGRDITDRKQTENALLESEKKYRNIFENIQDVYYEATIDGIIVEISPSISTISKGQYQRDDLIGKSIYNFYFNKVGRQTLLALLQEQGRVTDYEIFLKNRDGSHVPCSISAKIQFDAQGKPMKIIGSMHDITERKRAQEALIESEMKYRQLVAQSPDGIFILDLSGKFMSVNRTICDSLKYTEEELLSMKIWDIVPEQYQSLRKQRLEVIMNGESTNKVVEYEVKGKDGITHFVEILSVPYYEKNKIVGSQGIAHDITMRKQAEDSLRQYKEQLQFAHSSTNDGIWDVKMDSGSVYLSPRGCEILGYKPDDLQKIVAQWNQIVHPEDLPATNAALTAYLEGKTPIFIVEQRLKTFAGDFKWILTRGKAVSYDSNGKAIRMVGTHTDISERKQAEKALHESLERYKKLTQISPAGIFHTDENGLTTFVNQTWCKISGLSFEEALGNNWLNAVHPEDREKLFEGWKEASLFHKTSFSDYRFVRPDGSIAWVMGQAIPETNAEGKTIGYIGTITDITERKKAEDAISESNFFLQTLLNAIPVPVFYKDINGCYIGFNKAFERFFGKTSQELAGKTVFEISPRELAEIYHAKDMELIQQQGVQVYDAQMKDDHGVIHDVVYHKATIMDSNGHVGGLIGVILDITERKRAEKEIVMLAHSLKCINECVSITDLDDKILFANESFLKTYGYELDELIGKPISIVRSQNNVQELVKEILPSTTRGEWQGELLNKRKDGSEFPIFLSTTIIKDKDGNALGLIGVATDISAHRRSENELIKAKEKAEESDRLKSAFLANMSHEIRTPMNGILGFAGLLKEPNLSGEEQQDYISIIEKSGARMLNIINDIVSISKVESGQMEISISETNINEQLEYIYTFFKPEAAQNGIQFSFRNSLSVNDAIIKTDREKIYAILTNLVKNAMKFTQAGSIEFGYILKTGRDKVGLSSTSDELEFFVKDTGLGIRQEQKKLIFERFRQANESLNRNYEGAGLGLAISKAYVEMLGGKIWVESEFGKGSTFYFTIPYNREPEEKNVIENVVAAGEDTNQMKKLKILIAEDDEISEKFIALTIRIFGKEIFNARTGVEAVEACRNHPDIDLVMMDIKMPEMDGYEATRQIRKFNKDVVIIAQTAFALTGDKEKALAVGCNDYITKPIDHALLNALMEKHFLKAKK